MCLRSWRILSYMYLYVYIYTGRSTYVAKILEAYVCTYAQHIENVCIWRCSKILGTCTVVYKCSPCGYMIGRLEADNYGSLGEMDSTSHGCPSSARLHPMLLASTSSSMHAREARSGHRHSALSIHCRITAISGSVSVKPFLTGCHHPETATELFSPKGGDWTITSCRHSSGVHDESSG